MARIAKARGGGGGGKRGGAGGGAGSGGGRHQRQQHSGEEGSLNSSSTDTTKPTVHTNNHNRPRGVVGQQSSPSPSTSMEESTTSPRATTGLSTNSSNLSIGISKSNNKNLIPTSCSSGNLTLKANHRQRVPGGAAAKLMLRGPKKSLSSDNSSYIAQNNNHDDNQDDGPVDTSEIFEIMNKTKAEFEHGPAKMDRYSPLTIVGDEEIEVSFQCTGVKLAVQPDQLQNGTNKGRLPHILNRDEAYYENASVAVAAILAPTSRGGDVSVASALTDLYSVQSYHTGASRNSLHASVSAFQSPKYSDALSTNGSDEYEGGGGQGLHKSPTTEPFISTATEEKLDKMSSKMLDPSKTLSDLLRSIASPDDTTTMDRAYMVRRKNACGALKVLTAHNRRRKQICWTVGVLPALASVLQDGGDGEQLEHVYPDARTRAEYEETCRRAIAALTNLVMPVPNRLAVFHTPGLVQALITVVQRDDGECLEGACAVLAYLAKSNENKILMAQVPGLLEAVLRVLKPQMNDPPDSPKRRDYPWSSSHSDSGSSVSSGEDDVSIVSGSTDMSSEGETTDEELEEDEQMEEAEFTDDDLSTDGESLTGSEGSSGSSTSESSGEDSRSERRPPAKRSNRNKDNNNRSKVPSTNSCKGRLHSDYDKDKFISGARKNLFAMLGHLAKEKDNAYRLARVNELVAVVVDISKMHESPIHVLAVQFLAHLTRHRLNSKTLVFKAQVVIPAVVKATYSNNEVARRYACFAIQNFSHDKSCRQELASSEKLIIALCKRARHSKDPEERLAAICALKNLTDEPANLIPLSNTAECIATLMQIAHGQEEGVTEMMQFRACDALATISHWLRKIATNGQSMDAVKNGETKPTGMFVPSLKVVPWEQYE